MPVGFRGVVLSAPGVASYIDDSQATAGVTAAPTAVAVVGVAERGQPNTALAFTDSSSVLAVYGSATSTAPLSDGLIRALNGGAGTVYGVRVGRSKPLTSSLVYTTSGQSPTTTTGINILTKEYGKFCRSWSLSIQASTNTYTVNGASVGRKATLTIHDGSSFTADNIAKNLLTIVSNSLTVTGQVSVTDSGITLTPTSGGSAATFTFSDYPRLNVMIAAINAAGVFKASLASGSDGNILSSTIDQVVGSAGNVPIYSGTPYVLTGNTKALCDALNGSILGSFLNASYVANVPAITTGVYSFTYYTSTGCSFTGYIVNSTLTVTEVASGTLVVGSVISGSTTVQGTSIIAFVSGSGGTGTYTISQSPQTVGSSGTPVALTASAVVGTVSDYDPAAIDSDWTNAFVALQSVPAYFVVPMTANPTYHATALAHVNAMSLPTGKSERIAIIGGAAGETYIQAKARASALNDKRSVLVWPGIKDYDNTGTLVTLAPYYFAPQLAGILAGQGDPAEPLTNKAVGLYGLETISSNAVIDDLVNNGVFTIQNQVNRGFVVVQSLTTWTGDLKFSRREISTVRAADEVMSEVRRYVTSFVGKKSTSDLVGQITSTVTATLSRCASKGLIVADPANPGLYPAYKNVVVRVFGDAFYIDFNISPAKPANYLLITAYVS